MNKNIYFLFLFFFLLGFQVLVLNNILFLDYINPYLYIAFIFLYPLRENRFPFLTLAFLLGLFVDFFTNSGGIHAFATLFIAYLRLTIFKSVFKKNEGDFPFFNLREESFGKVFNYVIILTIIHHFILFTLANFSFDNFTNVLLNTLYSTIFTSLVFFLGNYIFSSKKS